MAALFVASHVAAVAGTAAELGVEAVKKKIADRVLEGALNRADRNPTFHAFSVSARDQVRRGEQVGSTRAIVVALGSRTIATSCPIILLARISTLSRSVRASWQAVRRYPP